MISKMRQSEHVKAAYALMKTHLITSLCVLATNAVLSAREFTDLQGRKLDAEIISASAGQVTLKRNSDGRMFSNVPANSFSEADQKFIADWAAANINYNLEVSYTKKKISETKKKMNNTTYEQEVWVYKINVKNRLPVALSDLRVDYWCFRREDGGKGKGAARLETSGTTTIPFLAGSGTVTVDTSEIILNKQKLDAGFYYTNGARDIQADGMGGLAVRVFDKAGKEAHSWATKDDLLAAAVGRPKAAGSNSENSSKPK